MAPTTTAPSRSTRSTGAERALHRRRGGAAAEVPSLVRAGEVYTRQRRRRDDRAVLRRAGAQGRSPAPTVHGDVDEAQAQIGVARALAAVTQQVPGGHGVLDEILVSVARDLWVLMAELATAPRTTTSWRMARPGRPQRWSSAWSN